MEQRKQGGGLAEASIIAGISSPAAPLGSGALFRLALPQQKDEQQLREAWYEQRGVRLHSHDTPYGKRLACS